MQVKAKLRNAPMSAQKCRLIINQIRGLTVSRALEVLTFSPKKAARIVKKVLDSAIANAEHNRGADIDTLSVNSAFVDQGRVLKRMRARAKGRGNRILKPSCHITVQVTDNDERSSNGSES